MWLIKSEEEIDPNYGKNPKERTIEELIKTSVIIVDKHAGPTSHQVTDWTKKIFQVNKCGHSGTLDPMVTGVLPIALQEATKTMPVLMGLDKEYIGVMHLHKEVPEDLLRDTVLKFVGKIRQLPPVRSAVARKPRIREVKFLDILEIDGKDVLFHVGTEAGTYIRKLVSDIGQSIGGAHMSELRRIKVGSFTEKQSHSLLEVKDAYEIWKEGNEKLLREILIPIEHAILHVKRVFAKDSAIDAICNGSPVFVSCITKIQEGIEKDEMVGVYSLKEELVALGVAKMISEEMFRLTKDVVVKTDRVFMKKGTYPKQF